MADQLSRAERNSLALRRSDGLSRHGKRALTGSFVTMIGQVSRMLITIAGTAILARLLRPEDFGILAMAATVTTFLSMFTDMGLSLSTVQREKLSQTVVSTLFFLNILMGLSVFLIAVVAAPIAGFLFQDFRVTLAIVILSFSIPLAAAGAQHNALLGRAMRWLPQQLSQTVGQLVAVIVVIAMVWLGWSDYKVLLVQPLLSAAITTSMVWFYADWLPDRVFRLEEAKSEIGLGIGVTGFNFINYFHRQLDNLMIGWWWGAAPLGLYSRAYNIFASVQGLCSWPISGVLVPLLSRARQDPDYYNRVMLDSVAAVAMLNGLLGTLLVCLSDNIIYALLGRQWSEAADVFRFLAPSILVSGNAVLGTIFMARGDTRAMQISAVLNTIGFAIGFAVATPHGIAAVGAAYSIVQLVTWPLTVHLALKPEALAQRRYYAVTLPILAVAMLVTTCSLKMFETRFEPMPLLELAFRAGLISCSFCALALALTWIVPDLRIFRQRFWGVFLEYLEALRVKRKLQ